MNDIGQAWRTRWWTIAAPAAVCMLTTGYAALITPRWWIIMTAFVSTALCAAGTAVSSFALVGWSGVAAIATCGASLVENPRVYWAEPVFMCLGAMAMMEIAHITCIIRTPEVNGSSITCTCVSHEDERAAFIAQLSNMALRLGVSAIGSLSLTRLYLAAAASGVLHDSDALFVMLLGAVAMGACMYWLVRTFVQD